MGRECTRIEQVAYRREFAFIRGPFCLTRTVQNVGVSGIRWVAGLLVIVALLAIFARRHK